MKKDKSGNKKGDVGNAIRLIVEHFHLLEEYKGRKSHSINEIAKFLGCSFSTLHQHLKK